jgi:hypothetical protein
MRGLFFMQLNRFKKNRVFDSNKNRSIINIFLITILVFSLMQFAPQNLKVIEKAEASSIYSETNWSAAQNHSAASQVSFIKESGDVKLRYGQWVFVCDRSNNRLVHTMLGGSGWTTYGAWGTGTGSFRWPLAMDYDINTGFLYIADNINYRVIKTKMGGTGWTSYGTWGSGTGNFNRLSDVHYDNNTGFIYIADTWNHRIVKTKIDGTGWISYGSQGSGTGEFNRPTGVYHDTLTDLVYVADSGNHRIVRTLLDGAGWETLGSQGNSSNQFNSPNRVHYDNNTEYLYISDSSNNRIVKTMFNGTGWTAYGSQGAGKGNFNYPTGIHYDNTTDFVYVTDSNNNRIVRTKMNGSGWYNYGSSGTGTNQFSGPYDVFPTNTSYASTGYLISRKIDLNSPANLLTLSWVADMPANTTVKFHLRTAPNETAIDGKNFVGPNGSANRYYTTSGDAIWNGHEGHQWVQYKVFLSTNEPQQTPVLKDVSFTYNLLPNSPKLLAPWSNNWTNDNTTTFSWEHRDIDSSGQAGYQWQIDDKNNFNQPNYDSNKIYTSQKTFTPTTIIPDGEWFWHVRTLDTDGGWGPYSGFRKIKIDTTPPSSGIDKPKEDVYYKQLNYIYGKAMDSVFPSGVNKTEISIIRLADNNYWDGTGWSGSETWLLADGYEEWIYNSTQVQWESGLRYRVQSRTYDNVTNLEIPQTGITFNFDIEHPISKVGYPINDSAHNKMEKLNGTSYDIGGSGVKRVEISIEQLSNGRYWDGKVWVTDKTWINTVGTTSWSYDSRSVLWDTGTSYKITSRATDKINIVEPPTDSNTFIFDIDRPESTVTAPADDVFLNEVNVIYGQANDIGGAGIQSVDISIRRKSDNTYWNNVEWGSSLRWLKTDGFEHWSIDASTIEWTTDRYYVITSKSTDNASNYMISPMENTFMFDNKPPTQDFSINNDDEFTNSTIIQLSLDATDTGSGVNAMAFSEDGKIWTDWFNFSYSYTFELSSGDGQKTVYFKTLDLADNSAEPVTKSITLDTVLPEASIIINEGAEYTNSKTLNLALTAVDSASGITDMAFSTDMETWSPWEPFEVLKVYSLSGDDGQKTVYFRVMDNAGNIKIVSDNILLDTTPPKNLEIVINDGAETADSATVSLKLKAEDTGSGIDKMSFCTLVQTWCDWEDYSDSRAYDVISESGQKIIYFRVTDKAGNIATPVSSTIVLELEEDTTPDKKETPSEDEFELFSLMNIIIIVIIIVMILILAAVARNRSKKKVAEEAAKAEAAKAAAAEPSTPTSTATADAFGTDTTAAYAQLPATQTTTTTQPQLPPAPDYTQTQSPGQLKIIDSVVRDGVAVPITTTPSTSTPTPPPTPTQTTPGYVQAQAQPTQPSTSTGTAAAETATVTPIQAATPIAEYQPQPQQQTQPEQTQPAPPTTSQEPPQVTMPEHTSAQAHAEQTDTGQQQEQQQQQQQQPIQRPGLTPEQQKNENTNNSDETSN